jgi:hypothetical protein
MTKVHGDKSVREAHQVIDSPHLVMSPFRAENQVNVSSESRSFLHSPPLLIMMTAKIPVR